MIKELKKEWLFAIRNGRLFILLMSFLFLAILTPIMLKVILPEILKWQFPSFSPEDLSMMINASHLTSVQGFMSDVFELGLIIIVFSLCGILAQELRDNTFVLPLVSGNKFAHMIAAKLSVFGFTLMIIVLLTILINYAYSGVLFEFDVAFTDVLASGILLGFYMVYIIANLIMWGALLKRTLPAGFITLVVAYLIHALGSLFDIHRFLPSGLIHSSSQFQFEWLPILSSVGITLVVIAAMMMITHTTLKKMEYNIR